MYEGLNSPSIHTPMNLAEYSQTVLRYPNVQIWAGGTNIMTRPKAYPSRSTDSEIVYLKGIEELKKITRNDRMIEIGATVTLDSILKNHRNYIPEILKENILAIGSPLITGRATFGGAIAARNPMTSLPGTLITLGANAEVRSVRKKTVKSRWIPISLMVNESKDGMVTLPPRSLTTRVRVSLLASDYYYFKEEGSYIDDPDNAVAVALTAREGQMDTLLNPHFAITFPTKGIVYSKDLDNILMQLHFPLSEGEFSQLLQIIYTFINAVAPNTTVLQKRRLDNILEDMVNGINAKVFAPSQIEQAQNKGNNIE